MTSISANIQIQKNLHHILSTIWVLLCALFLFLNADGQFNIYLAILIIIIDSHSLYKVKNNIYLFIIYGIILFSNYSICMANYIDPISSFFTSWNELPVATEGLHVLVVFSLFLNILTNTRGFQPPALIRHNKNNIIIACVTWVILVCIGILAFDRPDFAGDRGSPSVLYEYSTILAILGIYYSGRKIWLHVLYIVTLIGFAMQNFIFGGRVTGVQLLVAIFLCFFNDRIKLRYIFPFLLIGFVLMNAIGHFRANLSLNAETLLSVWADLKNNKMILDTAYSSYFTSLTFLATLPLVTWSIRLQMFLRYVLYIFVGSSVQDSNLAYFTHTYFNHYFGGILPFFGYFYLGWIGIILSTYYLRFLFKHIREISIQSSGLWRCLAIYITITSFRWYLYNPSQILRGVFLFIVCYGVCYLFHRTTYQSTSLTYQKNNV